MIWLLIFSVLFAAYGLASVTDQRLRRHGVHVLTWRWLTGESHHGKAQTNRGWTRPATKALTPTGHARHWYWLPRWQHTLYRSGRTLLAVLLAADLLFRRDRLAAYLAVTAPPAAAYAGWRAAERIRTYSHRKNYMKPLHVRLSYLVPVPVPARPESWLEVAPDRSYAALTMPRAMALPSAADQLAIESAAASTLGMKNARPSWRKTGPHMQLRLTVPVPPPRWVYLNTLEWDGRAAEGVPLDAIRQAILAAGAHEFILGIGEDGAIVKISLQHDSPHIAMSVDSGHGKSVLVRCLVAQVLFRGGIAAILDNKLVSHPSLRALPNVAYADDIDKIHNFLEWLDGELDRRARFVRSHTDVHGNLTGSPGPPLVVVLEEQNMTTNRLRSYWDQRRAEDKTLPKEQRENLPAVSPAVRGYENASYAGRELNVHLVFVSQRFTAEAAGGGSKGAAIRMNTGIRILAGYDDDTWKMLVGKQTPMPPPSKHRGRMQVYIKGGGLTGTQVAFFTHKETRQFAEGGSGKVPAALRHLTVFDIPGATPPASVAGSPPPGARVIEGPAPEPVAPRNWMTIAQARQAGHLPASWSNPGASFRVAKHRAAKRGLPVPEVMAMKGSEALYDAVDLADFLETITSGR